MRSRIYQPEIMDEETPDQATVDEIYRYLAAVNRFLGGVRATIARFEQFSRTWRAGERIEVLEVACGAADVPRALIAWGRSRGFDLRVTATDILPSALDYAQTCRSRRRAPAPGLRRRRAPALQGPDIRLRHVRALLPPPDRRPDHQRPRILRSTRRSRHRRQRPRPFAARVCLDLALHAGRSIRSCITTARCRSGAR